MKLWLVCFLVLFFGAEGFQWFVGLHWFSGAEFSLPTVLIGGAGLAIASNYRYLQTLGLFPSDEVHSLPSPSSQSLPVTGPPHSQPTQSVQPAKPESVRGKSISFEIRKPEG
jgi:hypothetical protein